MGCIRALPLAGAVALAVALAACGTPTPDVPILGVTDAHPNPAGASVFEPALVTSTRAEFGRVTEVLLLDPGTRASGANAAFGSGVVPGPGGMFGGGRVVGTILATVSDTPAGYPPTSTPRYFTYEGPLYRVWVQTDSGATHAYDVSPSAALAAGDRVRIQNGLIYLA